MTVILKMTRRERDKMNEHLTVANARHLLNQEVAEDDSNSHCPLCLKRVRNDVKGMTPYQALALRGFYEHDRALPGTSAHAATLLKNTEAVRDHGVALLRHWGLLAVIDRPEDATEEQKGSRGLSGFYAITASGKAFVEGLLKVPKNIVKKFGDTTWRTQGKLISFSQALQSIQVTRNGKVVNGMTITP